MLGKKYLTIGDLAIPNPISTTISYKNIENVNTSEAGTDLVNITRLMKRTIKIQLNSSSFWLDRYVELCKVKQTVLYFRGEEIQVRARLTGASLIENSEMTNNTDGLYEVNIELLEI